MGNEKLIFYLITNQYYTIFLIIIVTFFVIATKKVTKEKSRQTRSLRAFCLAGATLLVTAFLRVKITNMNVAYKGDAFFSTIIFKSRSSFL